MESKVLFYGITKKVTSTCMIKLQAFIFLPLLQGHTDMHNAGLYKAEYTINT